MAHCNAFLKAIGIPLALQSHHKGRSSHWWSRKRAI